MYCTAVCRRCVVKLILSDTVPVYFSDGRDRQRLSTRSDLTRNPKNAPVSKLVVIEYFVRGERGSLLRLVI